MKRGVSMLAVLALVAGCGSSSHPSSKAAVAACVRQQGASSSNSAGVRTTTKAIKSFCKTAGREGLVAGDGSIPTDKARQVIQRHPEIMFPLCTKAMTIAYSSVRAPSELYLSLDPFVVGRRMCRLLIAQGEILPNGTIPPAGLNHLLRIHPEFGAPFVFAGLLAAYEQREIPGIPRTLFLKAARFAAYDAPAQGLVTTTGLNASDFHLNGGRFLALFARELKRVGG